METIPAPGIEPEPARHLSFPARVIGVFVNPRPTFEDIARHPSFLAALILVALFNLAAAVTAVQRIGPERIVEKLFENNPRVADLPAEQRERMIERTAVIVRYQMYLGPLIGLPLASLLAAGIFMVLANFVLGAEARFKAMFAGTVYGFMPSCVAGVLTIVVILLKDPTDFDIENPAATNLGLLFDARAHPGLYRLGASLDLFSFWQVALLALGVAAAARFSFKKGLLVVLIPWALWVLGRAGIASLF